jgi:hypothetical protein
MTRDSEPQSKRGSKTPWERVMPQEGVRGAACLWEAPRPSADWYQRRRTMAQGHEGLVACAPRLDGPVAVRGAWRKGRLKLRPLLLGAEHYWHWRGEDLDTAVRGLV